MVDLFGKTIITPPDLAALNSDVWYPLRIANSNTGYVGFGLQKNSEFRELFNHHLRKESGDTYGGITGIMIFRCLN